MKLSATIGLEGQEPVKAYWLGGQQGPRKKRRKKEHIRRAPQLLSVCIQCLPKRLFLYSMCLCTHMWECVYLCVYACICVCQSTWECVWTFVCGREYAHTYALRNMCVCQCVRVVCVCVCPWIPRLWLCRSKYNRWVLFFSITVWIPGIRLVCQTWQEVFYTVNHLIVSHMNSLLCLW